MKTGRSRRISCAPKKSALLIAHMKIFKRWRRLVKKIAHSELVYAFYKERAASRAFSGAVQTPRIRTAYASPFRVISADFRLGVLKNAGSTMQYFQDPGCFIMHLAGEFKNNLLTKLIFKISCPPQLS